MLRTRQGSLLATTILTGSLLVSGLANAAIEEITVTATKREASMQDVPIAVSAFGEMQIERAGFKDLRDLGRMSPSFTMNSTQTESQGTTFRMRGVGTTGNNIGLESAVGVFLDGVYLSRPGIALGEMMDLEQIEVLRGPQGTLFGRNTTAGAISIKTKAPNLSETEAFINLGYGSYNEHSVQFGGSMPIAEDTFALRVSGALRKREGYMTSVTGSETVNRDRIFLRGQALWEPTDNISLRVIADYSEADENCCDAAIVVESNDTLTNALTARAGSDGVTFLGATAVEDFRSNGEYFENPFEQRGLSGEFKIDLGFGTFTYIGALREFKAESLQHSDFVSLDVFHVPASYDDIDSTSHEFRLQGQNGPLDWMVGAYISDETIEEQATMMLGEDYSEYISAVLFDTILPAYGASQAVLALGGGGVPLAVGGTVADVGLAADPVIAFAGGVDPAGSYATNLYRQDGQSWSIFTHNTLEVAENMDFVLGLRYINEEKTGSFDQLDANSPACLNTLANAAAIGASPFATVGQLAVAFTCFPFATMADIPGSPVTPATYDDTFDDSELTGTASFVYRWNDNINTYVTYSHGFKAGGFNLDSTAAIGGASPSFDSEIVDSYEAGLKSTLLDNRLRANISIFHMDIEDFQVLEFTGIQFVTFNVGKAKTTGAEAELLLSYFEGLDLGLNITYADARYPHDCDNGVFNATVSSLCGFDLTNASKWRGNINANYETALPNTDLIGFVNGTLHFESKRRTSTLPRLTAQWQEGNVKVDLMAGVGPEDGRWSFEVWGRNLTDEVTRNVTFNVPLRGSDSLLPGSGARGSFMDEPRTWGVTLRARF